MKKLFAKLMAAVLVLTSLTFPVFAGTKMTGEEEVKYWKLVDDDLVKDTIEGGTYTLITGTSKPEEWEEEWYVVSGKVTISRPVTVSGEVNLILMDGSSLTVDASKSDKCAAICVAEETDSLSIFVQSYGKYMGKLKAAGGKYGAAIGGGVGGERGLGGLGGAAGKGGEGGDAGTAGSSGAPGY